MYLLNLAMPDSTDGQVQEEYVG